MKTSDRVTTPGWVLAVSLIFAAAAFLPMTTEASDAALPGDIVLGDSIEFGIGSTTGGGYVVPFHAYLEAVFGSAVDFHNLSEPGAETKDIQIEQLHEALVEVQNHRPHGVVITWGGGGDDLLHFIQSPAAVTCLHVQSCLARINALLNEAEQHVDVTLKRLRALAPDGTILVRTQYNPLLKFGCDPNNQALLATAALEGTAPPLRGLNPRLRDLAAKYDANVVDIFGPFFVLPDLLIDADCIHPNDFGYALILGIAISAFGP
ncbi:MAG: SGNH/GDSL hydrolase family protein [Gammaproteobacteria bacterium]